MSLSIPEHLLPDGAAFPFWEDETAYNRSCHVARNHPAASDDNPGTEEAPFASVSHAAKVMEPGERVIIHEGVYRECVRPARGGAGFSAMIGYEAAPGETAILSGAELWRPAPVRSEGWIRPRNATSAPIWMADLPEGVFAGYNPFQIRNAYEAIDKFAQLSDTGFVQRAMLRRGMVFYRGERLRQVYRYQNLADADGAFWVEDPGLRIHFRLPADADPSDVELEVTAREQIFAPTTPNLGYIRIRGLQFQHAADGLPVPQRAAVSTSRGHHWIVQDNAIRWANGCGLDIGCQHWSMPVPEECGGHVIRGNAIRDCGICGIAGVKGVHETLVEDNRIERIGFHNLERMWECAGLKFHFARNSLIRRNVFRHLRDACGLWLDCGDVNNRICNNVFADIASILGAVFSEMNYDVNLVDHNLVWDIRDPEQSGDPGQGPGVKADCNEHLLVANNLIGRAAGGIMITLNQADRKVAGRTGLCRANRILNNLLIDTPLRVHFGRRERNQCDGNLYQTANDPGSFHIQHPAPETWQNLAGWQEFFDWDVHGSQAAITARFDPDTLTLTLRMTGPPPECRPIQLGSRTCDITSPGPLDPALWQAVMRGDEVSQTFPRRETPS